MKLLSFSICFLLLSCNKSPIPTDLKLVRIFSTNSPGQKQDVEIYKQNFPGFNVEWVERSSEQEDGATPIAFSGKALVNIFIEHVYDVQATQKAKYNWLMVNQEFVDAPERLANIDLVLCKTKLATDLMVKYAEKYHLKFLVYYTKFTSLIKTEVSSKKDFDLALHSAGKSPFKNTGSVLHAWMRHPEFPKLIVTCRDFTSTESSGCFSNNAKPVLSEYKIPTQKNHIHIAANLELFTSFVPETQLAMWQDTAGYYIVPSSIEGYGHYLNEGRAKGAVIITTNAPPMNEMVIEGVSGFLVPVNHSWVMNSYTDARAYSIDSEDLVKVMKAVIALPEEAKLKIGEKARLKFLAEQNYFKERMKILVSSLAERGDLSGIPLSAYDIGDLKIYVINLDRSRSRLKAIHQEFLNAGMEFTRFRAVDGKEEKLDANKLEEKGIYKPMYLVDDERMTPGEFGAYESHYRILNDILQENISKAIVFEDDVRFDPELETNLQIVISNAPSDWDMIYLGCRVGKTQGADPEKLEHVGSFSLYLGGKEASATFLRLDGKTTAGAHAYIVKESMARHLVSHMMPIRGPVDLVWQILFIGNPHGTSMFGPRHAYCVYPELVRPDDFLPSIIKEYGRKESEQP